MDDIEYEDFLPTVRKSLYGKTGKTKSGIKPNENIHPKSKNVKFDPVEGLQFKKSKSFKQRAATPYKKKFKKSMHVQNGAALSGSKQIQKSKKHIAAAIKKKKVVISFSSDSESFEEDSQFTPSKSELETFQHSLNNSSKRKFSYISDSESEDNETDDLNFDLDSYFNSHDISELNESITEAHSGINYEFVSDLANNAKIMGSESIVDWKNEKISHTESSDKDSDKSDDKVSSIIEKVQELMVISEDCTADGDGRVSDECKESEQYTEIGEEHKEVSDGYTETSGEFKETSDENTKSSPIISRDRNEQLYEGILNDFCNAEYHDFNEKKLVCLKENQSVSFHGLFTLKVIYGKLEILGFVLDTTSNAINLYSPRGSALLYIKNVTQSKNSDERVEISQILNIHSSLETTNNISLEANGAAFLCTKLEDYRIQFLEKYVPQKLFPRLKNSGLPQVVFEPTENWNSLKSSSRWNDSLDNVTCNTKLLIAGGKGVGKSTFLRFAINRLLNRFDKVRVLDLDPGQSEFTPPGSVSIVTVTEPIFGPNFTHLKQPDRSFLSNINVGHDPRSYLMCIKHLVPYLETSPGDCPVLVNYMGFSQGIGLNIIAAAVKYIRPTDVIQIHSNMVKKNFKVDLTPQAIEENSKLFSESEKIYSYHSELKYKLHKIPAMNDENDGWILEPRRSREMYILMYFGQMMQNNIKSLTSHELTMYEINLSDIKITNLQGEEIAPAAANANMVALCILEEESNMFECMGYGVIRGIDIECDKLILTTPEQPAVLENVYYLVVPSVSLPPSVYMTPDDVIGAIPYVMEGELLSLGQITKRSYLPANKK